MESFNHDIDDLCPDRTPALVLQALQWEVQKGVILNLSKFRVYNHMSIFCR